MPQYRVCVLGTIITPKIHDVSAIDGVARIADAFRLWNEENLVRQRRALHAELRKISMDRILLIADASESGRVEWKRLGDSKDKVKRELRRMCNEWAKEHGLYLLRGITNPTVVLWTREGAVTRGFIDDWHGDEVEQYGEKRTERRGRKDADTITNDKYI